MTFVGTVFWMNWHTEKKEGSIGGEHIGIWTRPIQNQIERQGHEFHVVFKR